MKITLPQPKRAYCEPDPDVEITRGEEDGDDTIALAVPGETIKLDASALMRALVALGVTP